MKRIKRFMAALLCLALILALSGCANRSADDQKNNAEEAQEIIYWSRSLGDSFTEHMNSLIAEYNSEKHGYEVQVEWVEQSMWDEKIAAARASGNSPDILNISYSWVNSNITSGYIQAIDDLLDPKIEGDILPGIYSKVHLNGHTYAMPIYVESSMLLYYRKDLLAEAGYSEAPKTWDELIEIAHAVQNDAVFGLSVPYFNAGFAWGTWGIQYNLVGHRQITENWDAPAIGEEYKPFFELFKRFYDEKVVPQQALAVYDSIRPFAAGNVAMQLCGAWGIASLLSTYADMDICQDFEGKIGIAAAPAFDNAASPEVTATGGGWAIAIDAQTKVAQGCADFINWLYDLEHPERMGSISADEGFCRAVPTNTLVRYVNEQAAQAGVEYADVVNAVAASAINEPNYLYDISTAVERAVESYAMGYTDDLDQVLNELNKTIQQVIDSNKLAGKNPEYQP